MHFRRIGLLLVVLAVIPLPARAQEDGSGRRVGFALIDHAVGLSTHKEMYALPYTYSGRYTQISFWEAYDAKASSPFRDTNYNPEIFYRWREYDVGSLKVGGDLGFEHQSNGQRVPLSRSWNLLYAAPWFRGDRWLAYVKARYRIPEAPKAYPGAAEGDDNPDITDYLGYTDIHLFYMAPKKVLLHLTVRGYVGTDKGNVSLNTSIPMPGDVAAFIVLRLFSGYGQSMMDYNKSINGVGIGLMYAR
ncbi:MAG: phospholipase A [Gemmatimonadota bacterium]